MRPGFPAVSPHLPREPTSVPSIVVSYSARRGHAPKRRTACQPRNMRFKTGVRVSVHAAAMRAASIHPRPHRTPHRTTPTAHPWQAPHTSPLVCKTHMRRSRPAPANDGPAAARRSPHKPTRKKPMLQPAGTPMWRKFVAFSCPQPHACASTDTGPDRLGQGKMRPPDAAERQRALQNPITALPAKPGGTPFSRKPKIIRTLFYGIRTWAQACGTARCQPTAQNCATRQPPATAC